MRIVFIRHGKTKGNLSKCYIGRTDEPLCDTGISELKERSYPECSVLVCSPMKRCVQTAEIIYPGQKIIFCSEMRECDFGDFEGKNHIMLTGDAAYQEWIDSGGTARFPNGESPHDLRRRCCEAFEKIMSVYKNETSAAFVVHGGTIMSVLEKYAVPKRGYYDSQCGNGEGYDCEWDGVHLYIRESI